MITIAYRVPSFCFAFVFLVLRLKLRALRVLNICTITESHPWPPVIISFMVSFGHWSAFSIKGQIVNILDFEGQTI